jgi:hypothetical protein
MLDNEAIQTTPYIGIPEAGDFLDVSSKKGKIAVSVDEVLLQFMGPKGAIPRDFWRGRSTFEIGEYGSVTNDDLMAKVIGNHLSELYQGVVNLKSYEESS